MGLLKLLQPAALPFDHVFALDARHDSAQLWSRLAEHAQAWLDAQGLSSRDAIVLLPFAQHLAPARRAWRCLSRWQPRVETTHSLASALGPSALPKPQQISLDVGMDALAARDLLQSQSWARAWRERDGRAFEQGVQALVELAHALWRRAGQLAPHQREAYWQRGREALALGGDTGQLERALGLVALEWAASDDRAPATDALFELRPSAWLHLQCGGPDPLAEALLSHAQAQGVPVLRLSAELELEQLAHASQAPNCRVEQALCADFEDLAQCSAAAVLQHLSEGRAPVALIAQDRVLLRRVRALLERRGVGLADETGWTLATTAEAAQLMALLRAARRDALLDDWLAWLKTPLAAGLRERAGAACLLSLESRCRQRGWVRPEAVHAAALTPSAARLWQLAREALSPWQQAGRASLQDWLVRLSELLQSLGADRALEAQEAGGQLLDALWLRRSPWPGSAHEAVAQHSRLGAGEFLAWVTATLEATQVVPPAPEQLQVMITPLARTMLRPFGALVLPGADEQTLGPVPAGPALLSDAQAQALGLPTQEARRQALAWQFAQLLRAPALTLLRCRARGSEPLGPSPLLERLRLALQAGGHAPLQDWQDPRTPRVLQAQPRTRASAAVQGRLPRQLSASAVDSLRQCPYQFFARVLLGLREQAELEGGADKRDYGTWLHGVLYRFHQARQQGEPLSLEQAAEQELAAQGLSPAEFLPFMASFARFAPQYLDWLAQHEAQGWQYAQGELEREVQPWPQHPELSGLALRGRLDRVDHGAQGWLLLDYKTGSLKSLQEKVAQPLEDTQLAVYAALMQGQTALDLSAQYLALDDSKGLAAVSHEAVQDSAEQLLEGLAQDLGALAAGAPLPALGEGLACAYCDMRGLCRRDDWQEEAL